MAKLIRLTESDLKRLVKRVIKEQQVERDEQGELEFEFNDKMVLLKDMDKEQVQNYLSKLPESLIFLAIVNCEGADFSDVDICSLQNLHFVNLRGTPNNFEESVDCDYTAVMDDLFDFSM